MSVAIIVVIALVFIIGLACGGGLIWIFLRRQKVVKSAGEARPIIKTATALRFHIGLVALPLALFLLCSILVIAFYPSLPLEVAYRFSSTGVAKGWLGREAFVAVMLGAQLIFLLASWVIAAALTRIGQQMLQSSRLPASPGRMIWLMANMVSLPQLIAAFIMVDAIIFARSQHHIMTPWLFALLAIALGSIVLIILFMQSIKQSRNGSA
jgi:uncharacterized membrane protein